MVGGGWNLVGRDELVERVVHDLTRDDVDGVLLVGPPGVGTTRLLHEVVALVEVQGRTTLRAIGSVAHRPHPFAALAHVIPGSLDGALAPLEVFDRFRASLTGRRRAVLAVDDVPLLDDESLGLVTQLLAAGLLVLVGTLHEGQDIPPSLATIERSAQVRRTSVEPLSQRHVLDLLERALGGAVDGHAALALADASQGRPGYLAELIEGSLASGRLTEVLGAWTLRGEPVVSDRLARTFDRSTSGLTDSQRDLLDLVALAEPVALDAVERAGLLDDAVALEQRGVLRATGEVRSTVTVAQPLMARQLRATMSSLRRRALLPRAIELIGDEPVGDDVLRAAQWRLECGRDVDVLLLEQAAGVARSYNDFEATEVFASAAARMEPTLGTLLLQAEALHDLCRFDEADRVVRQAGTLATDEMSLLRLAALRHRIAMWGRHDAAASVAALRESLEQIEHPMLRDFVHVAIANTVVFAGGVDQVAGVIAQIDPDDELAQAALMFPRSLSALFLGDVERAIELGREGVATRARYPDHHFIGPRELFGLALGMALTDDGQYEAADAVLGRAYADVVEQRIPQSHTWLALARGRNALYQGRLAEARRWILEGRSVAERSRFSAGLRVALMGLMACAGQMGDVVTAQAAAAACSDLPPDHGLLWPERLMGYAWAEAADGRPESGVAMLLEGAEEARQRCEHLLVAEMLYEAARLGAARHVLADFEIAVAKCNGRVMAARALFVRGRAADDATLLAAAEKAFARTNAWLPAAESAACLARVLAAAGRPRDAQGAMARSAQYRDDLGPVATPALAEVSSRMELSPREHEIALLAAKGVPSKTIAAELGLSVRTVSNHLQNAYLKLGISGREELADRLGR